jgi:hypothetical protein
MARPTFERRALLLPHMKQREVGGQMDFQNLRLGFCFLYFSKLHKKLLSMEFKDLQMVLGRCYSFDKFFCGQDGLAVHISIIK